MMLATITHLRARPSSEDPESNGRELPEWGFRPNSGDEEIFNGIGRRRTTVSTGAVISRNWSRRSIARTKFGLRPAQAIGEHECLWLTGIYGRSRPKQLKGTDRLGVSSANFRRAKFSRHAA
jgi:hypothetical protein